MKNPAPRYVVNPAASVKSLWFPAIHQMLLDRPNKSYLNSLWIGTLGNLLSVPYRVVDEIALPLFNFRFLFAALATIVVPITIVTVMIAGIFGRASGVQITLDQRIDSVILDEEQGQQALEQGCDLVVLDIVMLLAQDAGLFFEGTFIPGHPPQDIV